MKLTIAGFLVKEFSDILGPLNTTPMQDLLMADAVQRAKEMEANLIADIDHRLSVIEDYAKGEAGDEITKLRKYISENYGK